MDEHMYRSTAEIHNAVSWPGLIRNHGNQVIQLLPLPDGTNIWHFTWKREEVPQVVSEHIVERKQTFYQLLFFTITQKTLIWEKLNSKVSNKKWIIFFVAWLA